VYFPFTEEREASALTPGAVKSSARDTAPRLTSTNSFRVTGVTYFIQW
jgi:hypothetical protein